MSAKCKCGCVPLTAEQIAHRTRTMSTLYIGSPAVVAAMQAVDADVNSVLGLGRDGKTFIVYNPHEHPL